MILGAQGVANRGAGREHVEGAHAEGAGLGDARHGGVNGVFKGQGDMGGGSVEALVGAAFDFFAVSSLHGARMAGWSLLGHRDAHGTDLLLADGVVVFPTPTRNSANQGGIGWGIPA